MQPGLRQIDIHRSGLENMSIDLAMLEQTSIDLIARLRVYRWSAPTISLGYFQRYSDYQKFDPTGQMQVMRRATGGGAILHHHDWTYCLAFPTALIDAGTQGASRRLYDVVHQSVRQWLLDFGVDACLWTEGQTESNYCSTVACPFLCFERRHSGDLVLGEHKVMGSAQRRTANAILQHGSLLLKSSQFAPQLCGLKSVVADTEMERSRFYAHLSGDLSRHWGISFTEVNSGEKIVQVPAALEQKLAREAWNAKIM